MFLVSTLGSQRKDWKESWLSGGRRWDPRHGNSAENHPCLTRITPQGCIATWSKRQMYVVYNLWYNVLSCNFPSGKATQDFSRMKPTAHTHLKSLDIYYRCMEFNRAWSQKLQKISWKSIAYAHSFPEGTANRSFNVLSHEHSRLLPNKFCILSYLSPIVLED